MVFECIDVLGVWKFSRLIGFGPKATSIYFDINGNIWYNRGVWKDTYSKTVVIITLKYFEFNSERNYLTLLEIREFFAFITYNINRTK